MIVWCMSLLCTEASTFDLIFSFELLAADNLSFVFSWNVLETISSLMQFRSVPVSKRAMVSISKSLEKTRVILIKYFLEVICFKTNKKSLGRDSMFPRFCSSLSSPGSDLLSELSCNCFCKRNWMVSELVFCFSFKSLISILISLISF